MPGEWNLDRGNKSVKGSGQGNIKRGWGKTSLPVIRGNTMGNGTWEQGLGSVSVKLIVSGNRKWEKEIGLIKKQSEKGNGEMGNKYHHPGVEYCCGYATI